MISRKICVNILQLNVLTEFNIPNVYKITRLALQFNNEVLKN